MRLNWRIIRQNTMKKNFYILYCVTTIFIFNNCEKAFEIPDDVIVKDFVWKGMNAYYLYQNQIEDLSDRRFSSDQELNSYLRTFSNPFDLFDNLLISDDNKSRLIEDYTILGEPELLMEKGFQFGAIIEPGTTDNVICYVLYTLPGSDAEASGLQRGDFFNAVNGTQLMRTNFEELLITNTDSEFELTMVDFDGTLVRPTGSSLTITNQTLIAPSIFMEKIITQGSEDIGYLMFNNEFSKVYLNDINQTILNFDNQAITKLVLDLRYSASGGTFARNIAKLGTMFTGKSSEETFIKEKWNTKAQPWFEINQPDSLVTKFPENLNVTTPLNSVALTDIYIVLNNTNFSGSSAIELLINSLNPHLNVHIIGNQTEGNNTGSITLYNSVDYDFAFRNDTHTFALQPVVLTFLNTNDLGYSRGFIPTLDLCNNEDILNLGDLGESSDPILNRILEFISIGNTTNSNCNSDDYEHIFNSRSLGANSVMFIEQNLPNTL